MKKQKIYSNKEKQNKTLETTLNETEAHDLLDKDFKITVIKMFTEVRRTMHEQSENFKKEIKKIRKYHTERSQSGRIQ